ncbi:MAG: helix-turn-helix domain-containing protein [Spirochaetales bacterium]|nr:helix-turn-helix domain-containing protein [Spirochaetales bacterium]
MIQNKRFVMDKNLRLMLAFLKVNEVQVLQKADIPVDFFSRKVLSLTGEEYFRLWNAMIELASRETPIPLMLDKIPLHAAINVPMMAALCAHDFITFTQRIREFKPLIGPLVLELDETKECYSVTIKSALPEITLHPMVVAIETIFFVKMIRYATGRHIVPQAVETSELLDDPGYEEYFGVKPAKGPVNRVVFRLEDARMAFEMENEAVWQQLEPELRQRLEELDTDTSFAARVRAILTELLPLGQSSIDGVSDKLCISPRTLQRRLKDENTTFQQQLNHSRELLSRHYLKNSELNITEIAFLLGYEEPSSFSRAFHIWTGLAPDAFRSAS